MVKQLQDINYNGRHSNIYFDSLPDFKKLAESYGHVGLDVDKIEDLNKTLDEAFAMKDKLVFVNIKVEEHEHVYPMQRRYGAIDDMFLAKGVVG
jgi:acetolactate synthase-1/2/3 large subunit